MEKVITIFDWWDGPLCGLTTFEGNKEYIEHNMQKYCIHFGYSE
jgi:hypothetical protein